ncbi:ead/Ea22-like family protein [Pseudomonas aeruginosa]|uniref:ead/Ea22-like family protein n=1 Tax=Pseudomonas aeruginosa TaxID=287 RepID=UPI002A69B7D2|nr:ead/Ea22-like family protein [Pseudomonas aeruginosa]MDY1084386.1 ead/Ea22-like family protein [Pseudomonas aeruginosa]
MTDHAELRRLAKAATPGPWRVQTGCSWRRIGTDSGDGDVLRPCTHPNDGWPDIVAPAENLKYIASANPKTILALLDEIDGLKAEKEALRKFAAEAYQVLGALDAPENILNNASDAASGDPLRHETLLPFFAEDYEALRKDAARYRWLRERDLETIRQGGVFAGMTPENIVLNQEDLDAAIDAALEGATQ